MSIDDTIGLYVSVPVACFRAPYARSYAESLPVPAPSTIYGMLLSMIGEKHRIVYAGASIAYAMISKPEKSKIFRRMWRIKTKDSKTGELHEVGIGENAAPDYQELLTGTEILVWVKKGREKVNVCLKDKVSNAISNPKSINRFGSLSLGESTHLVNDLGLIREVDKKAMRLIKPVSKDEIGEISLPIWPDHVGSFNTVWKQFIISEEEPYREPKESEFIAINPEN